ncbi:MAG: YihY/virulence factor BrkB family protein [Lactobacillaceae bacterium]|jgi:membrane protein|nr:YihY/virulence factor BrkB family protein [Lactobacillaceae bacterium]
MKALIAQIMANKYVKLFFEYLKRADLSNSSAAIAYYAILAIFPAIIVLAALIPFTGLTTKSAMTYAHGALPSSIYNMVLPIVDSILKHSGVGVISISLLVTLWSLSRVIALIRIVQNRIYGVEPKNIAIIERAISMVWMIVVIALMGILIVVASVGSNILEALPISHELTSKLETTKTMVVFLGLFLGMGIFNWVLPSSKPRLVWALAGTLVDIVGLLALTKLFGFYIAIAGKTYSFYQAVGSVIILLLWLNLIAMLTSFGTVVTAMLDTTWPGSGGLRTRLGNLAKRER